MKKSILALVAFVVSCLCRKPTLDVALSGLTSAIANVEAAAAGHATQAGKLAAQAADVTATAKQLSDASGEHAAIADRAVQIAYRLKALVA